MGFKDIVESGYSAQAQSTGMTIDAVGKVAQLTAGGAMAMGGASAGAMALEAGDIAGAEKGLSASKFGAQMVGQATGGYAGMYMSSALSSKMFNVENIQKLNELKEQQLLNAELKQKEAKMKLGNELLIDREKKMQKVKNASLKKKLDIQNKAYAKRKEIDDKQS